MLAESDFKNAIALSKDSIDNAYLWSNLGQVQMEIGELSEARLNLNKAIEIEPNFSEARSHQAFLIATENSSHKDELEIAKDDLRTVFATHDARTYWDYRALAAVNVALGDFKRAAKYQAAAVTILRSAGPKRFMESAITTHEAYERKN
jgi:tetratricopeptide (TPR) repeat protein